VTTQSLNDARDNIGVFTGGQGRNETESLTM